MRSVSALALFFAFPLLVHATRTQHAICDGYDDFALGKCRSTSLTVDGVLDSSPKRFVAKIAPGETLFIRAEEGIGNVAGMQVGG